MMAGTNSARVASECGKVSSHAIEFKSVFGILSHSVPALHEDGQPRQSQLRLK